MHMELRRTACPLMPEGLREAGIEDKYQVVDLCRQGQGKQVLAIMVVDEPVSGLTHLPEPCGVDVIYLQAPDG
jgi:hypothetical protein